MRSTITAAALTMLLGGTLATAQAATISISCGAVGLELKLCQDGANAWAQATGNQVNVISTPNSATERLALYQQMLAANSADVDVFQIDVIWPGILGNHFIDLSEHIDQAEIDQHFPAIIENNTVDGALVAMPWFTDAGVLYYRKDLLAKYGLEVPGTYPELAETTRRVLDGEADPDLLGFLWQGKQYEGLVCVALEVLSSFDGYVLDGDRIGIAEPAARRAFRFLRDLLVDGISPPMVTSADEEATRTVFGEGRAVFLRNWVYAWNLFEREGSEVEGRVGVAPIPPGPRGTGGATLGGWQLGISRSSSKQEQAWKLIAFLSRPESQAYLNRTIGYRPSRRSLYLASESSGGSEEGPLLPRLLPIIEHARPRPVTPLYLAISQTLQSEISAIVAGIKDVDEALEDARREIAFILEEAP